MNTRYVRATLTKPFRRQDGHVEIEITGRSLLAFSVAALALVKLSDLLGDLVVDLVLFRTLLAVVFLTFVPGLFVLLQFDYHEESFTTTVCYAFGLSLFLVMFVGGATSLLFPAVGIMRPLSLDWLIVTWVVLSGLLAWTSSGSLTFRVPEDRISDPRTPFFLLFLPTSVLGTIHYKLTGNNLVLLGLLTTIAVIPVVVTVRSRETWYLPLTVWSIALALLFHGMGLGSYTITQPLPQVTMEHLRWIPNHSDGLGSLLANGVLFPVYAVVSGLPIAVEWSIVNTFLVSFLPVTLYESFRRHISPKEAFLSAFLFMSAYSFYVLYPGAGRAATPVIFIALLGLAFSDRQLPASIQKLFLLAFGFGVAVSHYGTAYVVLFALMSGLAAFYTLQVLLYLNIPRWLPKRFTAVQSDGGRRSLGTSLTGVAPPLLRPSYLAYYGIFSMAWYLYTAEGAKFAVLPRKIIDAVSGVLYAEASGSTVSSFQQTYAGTAITVSKYLYVVFGLLMSLGIAIAVLRLVVLRDERIDAGYLAVAIGFMSMFVGSALPSGNGFAVARVMMIIFTFAVPFAVIGSRESGNFLEWMFRHDFSRVSSTWSGYLPSRTTLSLVLAVFLLLNIGVVSETVTNDVAPSNSLSGERLLNSDDPDFRLRATACGRCNVQTHVWRGNQIPREETVHVGLRMDNQRDYYRGTLAEQTDLPLSYNVIGANQSDVPSGDFLALLAHNRDLGGFAIGYKFNFYQRDMNAFTTGSQVYSNGYGVIYYENSYDNRTLN
ncbi:DUF2206 domain-containing protein [Halobellus limi]|uniref:DUF2206 domain-containing protein n=1 Tax=Halobellus limi TaxID=699433 RepID=A0A1H5TXA2_9EURY|nr:DUF2206 domain-containing protein [Halobellus limi]QCC47212.1 DUF2206 domain-containing protein [Halobellus limi]SEF67403.1 Uncharacterized membrane protein [Halobellus limi]